MNAAINLKHYTVSSTAKACGIELKGEMASQDISLEQEAKGSAGYSKRCKTLAKTKLPSVKQESNSKIAMHD